MKVFKSLVMVIVSVGFVMSMSSVAWSVQLGCRNPGSHQDVAKTPIIKNTTQNTLPFSTQINWTASDGDNGTITLNNPLPPNSEVQGLGKPGQVYTCTAETTGPGGPGPSPQPPKKQPTKLILKPDKPPTILMCPKGWHKKFMQGYKIYCVPDKPEKPINCPKGTIYFETECAVGCKPVIK